MVRAYSCRPAFALAIAVAALTLAVTPTAAQSTGQLKGKVVNVQGQPVEGANILIEFAGGMKREHKTKTNKKGDFFQIGLQPGAYKVTVEKDGQTASMNARVRLGETGEANLTLGAPAAAGAISAEEKAKLEAKTQALKKAFEEGVQLSQQSQFEPAIAKFQEVVAAAPRCGECYTNIGSIHLRQKQYDQAEAAFKQAIDVNPSLADAYNGLASVYNAQKKFDEASKASEQASKLSGAGGPGGASASVIFNQGVIHWNSGRMPEAKKAFEDAAKADPNFPEARYFLGLAMLNEGKLQEAATEFEAYLKLAPTGQYAEQAKGFVATIKK